MKPNQNLQAQGFYGTLPSCAPLAVPYVPAQQAHPPQYEAREALIKGTLYPGLNLPYLGMENTVLKPENIQTQLQSVAFAVQELSLYLDTHREDGEALEVYRCYQKVYQELCQQYEEQNGPLNHQQPGTGPYRWLDDPWPWEYCANREE